MSFIIHALLFCIKESTGLDHHTQNIAAAFIQCFDTDSPAFDCIDQNTVIFCISGHIDIIHGVDLGIYTARHASPVRCHHAVKAKFIT